MEFLFVNLFLDYNAQLEPYAFHDTQVVEIVDQYDHDCLPPEFQGNPLTFIKDSKTNKTCSRELTVSTVSIVVAKRQIGFWFLFIFIS